MGGGSSSCCLEDLGLRASESYQVEGKRYCVLRVLGEGGYAFVYLVRDDANAVFALKRLTVNTASARDSALREVELMRRLQHPNVLSLLASATVAVGGARAGAHDADDLPATHVLLLMPALTEGTLWDVCLGVQQRQGRLSVPALLSVLRQTALGLCALHEFGYAHWDVKPANVLLQGWRAALTPCGCPLRSDGHVTAPRAVLCDFGSARVARCPPAALTLAAARATARQLVESAAAECSALYRPPELFDCNDASAVGLTVDTWSLGCTLYASMHGDSPFAFAVNTGGSVPLAVLSGKFKWPMGVDAYPERVNALVTWMLTADPGQRPQMEAVAERLQTEIEDRGVGEGATQQMPPVWQATFEDDSALPALTLPGHAPAESLTPPQLPPRPGQTHGA